MSGVPRFARVWPSALRLTYRSAPWLSPLLALGVSFTCGCGSNAPKGDVVTQWHPSNATPGADAGADAQTPVGGQQQDLTCRAPQASEALAPREAAIDVGSQSSSAGGPAPVFTSDLYRRFEDLCGTCHTKGVNKGNLDVSLTTFPDLIDSKSLDLIRSDDPATGMPQDPFKKWSERTPDDPVVLFASALEAWIAAGRPKDLYYPTSAGTNDSAGDTPYRLQRETAMQMTNLGTCVPSPSMMMTKQDKAKELDALFAGLTEFTDLPKSLRDTDLNTLDSAELARQGVVAFAPAYTLWADYAQKIRYVRVPVGQSIHLDESTQTFQIPPNTRFYKTFHKKVVDLDGNVRWRKMETRLIVSRPDIERDGQTVPAALFGSYKWNEDETEATLENVPYRDGKDFSDDLFTYVTDERLEHQVIETGAQDLASALLESGARRHYAIPGADRCMHCHMGAPNKSFVLGFTPVQLNRRPMGEGGVIEPAGPDELNQIQRLVSYGVISVDKDQRILGLEDMQGGRKPRNDNELKAQGYMLGNCSHCHNPRGFPSQREPILAGVLNFYPSDTGGIFQFPLDKFSPRSFRGPNLDIRIPYITPSLFDHPDVLDRENAKRAKWILYIGPDASSQSRYDGISLLRTDDSHPGPPGPGRPLYAPWRSLVYRNVDTPFSYAELGSIFPHMPMDTPGYDCRVRQLLGSWMVSIPAQFTAGGFDSYDPVAADILEFNSSGEQPYEEVAPNDPGYDDAVTAAARRLARFQQSERYRDCPAPGEDIIAPEVDKDASRVVPLSLVAYLPNAEHALERYSPGIPARPHYTATDLRNPPNWVQRRDDWKAVLVDGAPDPSSAVVPIIRTLKYTKDVQTFATTPIPFGLWEPKSPCSVKLSTAPTVGSFAKNPPPWMTVARQLDPKAPVYMISPGAQVFATVCSKCHGPDATGVSTLANTISDLTGGKTRVADLRDGLFGPPGHPGDNIQTAFGIADGALGATLEDWAVRYVSWMGLGGTRAYIPAAVVSQISATDVLGERRKVTFYAGDNAANMLTVVKNFCTNVLLPAEVQFHPNTGQFERVNDGPAGGSLEGVGLIQTNGDGSLWESICQLGNPLFVRAMTWSSTSKSVMFQKLATSDDLTVLTQPQLNVISRAAYKATGAKVGDSTGAVLQELTDDNGAPWCVIAPASNDKDAFDAWQQELGIDVPLCPAQFPENPDHFHQGLIGDLTVGDADAWATRGAANAGMLVFAYLSALSKGEIKAQPPYDRCEDLP